MRRIASRQNPIVARYRLAARGDSDGVMLLDGAHLVADALVAGVTIREAAVAAAAIDPRRDSALHALAQRLEQRGVTTVEVTAPVMAALSPVRSSSPIVALADRPTHSRAVLASADALVVVAVDIQDPGNVGAIVRVAEAGGAAGVIVAGASADPFGWKALRGAMGSAFRLPIVIDKNDDLIASLRSARRRIIATAPRDGRPIFDVDLTGSAVLLIGGEGAGLPASILAAADERITIPMEPPVESLNTAVTAAIVIYEAKRQRMGAQAVRERA
jgi:TrmH family RNA methyltransferase